MRRAAAVAGGGAAAGGLAAWALWPEPRRIVVLGRTLRLPRWPRDLAGLRVAVVADMHAGAPHVDLDRVERVVGAVNRAAPDVVLLLGDYVDDQVAFAERVEPEAVAGRLEALRARLGSFADDWLEDGRRVARALREAGIVVLENDAACATPTFWIVGLGAAGDRPVEEDGRHLFVSAGIGTSRFPVRLRRPPEVAV